MSENVEEAHQIEDVGKCWGCSPRIIERMAEARWRTPPSILGLQWGWHRGWASLRHVSPYQKTPSRDRGKILKLVPKVTKGYEVQRMAKDEYNQMKLSFRDKGYIQYLKTSTIR